MKFFEQWRKEPNPEEVKEPRPKSHVVGKDESSFDEKNKSESVEKNQGSELDEYQKAGQELIDSYRRFFMTFAKDVSLSFRLSNGFYIDLETGVVNLDTKWFKEKGYSKEQLRWAVLHELSHFRDLATDPKKMMENFDYIKAEAKDTGVLILKKWEDAYGQSDPELIENLKKQQPLNPKKPTETMNQTERAAYDIHHTFYNILDDIYVNNMVATKAANYEASEAEGQQVRKLYQEKLFPETDYSKLPRHLQFIYKLIREEMVKDESVQVSDEVQTRLEQAIQFQGKDYTPQQIVDGFLKPRSGRDTKAGQRYFVARNTLEPIFKELLARDLAEWQPKKPDKQKGGKGGDNNEQAERSANPFEQPYQDFNENNPDQISDSAIEDWMNKNEDKKKIETAKKDQEAKEENKSAGQKANEAQDKMDQVWADKHGIKIETLRQYRRLEQEVAPYLEDLSKMWQRIIFGKTKILERGMAGHFKSGTEMDIGKVIDEWPKIDKGNAEEARVMKKMTQKEVLTERPELIRVRLVGDLSGSMDSNKKHILEQSLVLLLSSLREFNTHLNLTRQQTKSKLTVDTEVWLFGNEAKLVKPLRGQDDFDDDLAQMIKMFEQTSTELGSTCDHKPLKKIISSLDQEEQNRIAQGKIMEMVFEITDGGSSNSAATKKAVDELVEIGVIARAFQIGQTSDGERQIFNQVWNSNREEKLGEIVGEKIENLLPAITELLKKYLSHIRL